MELLRGRISRVKEHLKFNVVPYAVALGISALIFGLIAYYSYHFYAAHVRLSNGLKAEGLLKPEYTKITGRSGTRHKVSYTFTVDGNSYSGESTILLAPVSPRIAVIYDPADPSNNKIEGGRDSFEDWQQTGASIIAVVIVGILVSLISAALRALKKGRPEPDGLSSSDPVGNEAIRLRSLDKIQLSAERIVWIENHLKMLNQEIHGDRPRKSPDFFQTFHKFFWRARF